MPGFMSSLLLLTIGGLVGGVASVEENNGEQTVDFDALLKKIEKLEQKNAMLETKMTKEVTRLNKKIQHLEKPCESGKEKASINNITNTTSVRSRRQLVETYAAFFAVVTPHEYDHLGVNQDIVFDQASTNVGNVYDARHGIFTAPVDGLYVFFATVTGKHASDNSDYYAHFDVNGRKYAKFVTFPNEQSSQMIVVKLTSGDTVSIKNNLADDSILGSAFSTFSGFLLYEGSMDFDALIG